MVVFRFGQIVRVPEVVYITYNMGTWDCLIYMPVALGLEDYIRQIPHAHVMYMYTYIHIHSETYIMNSPLGNWSYFQGYLLQNKAMLLIKLAFQQ